MVVSRTEERVKRRLRQLAFAGAVVAFGDAFVPKFDAYQAFTAIPHFARWGATALAAIPLLGVSEFVRIPPIFGRIAVWLTAIVVFLAAANLIILMPAVQGRGTYQDVQIAQVLAVQDDHAQLVLEDGRQIAVQSTPHGLWMAQDGQCWTAEFIRGRFGVAWIDFAPRAASPGPGQPAWAHCFHIAGGLSSTPLEPKHGH
jgi:hypothetical protein